MTPPLPLVNQKSLIGRSGIVVLLIGLLTTAAALLGVWYIGRGDDGTNVMGWYVDYVLPAGALLVGIIAGSGYGMGSWWTGLRINRTTFVFVLLLQFCAYWVAQYLAFHVQHLVYKSTGEPLGFFDYFHLTTVEMVWKSTDDHSAGSSQAAPEPLGMWGYGLRVLEIIGFVGGAIIILIMLASRPYCETCRRYMTSRKLPTLPASVKARKVKASDELAQAAYSTEQAQAAAGGESLFTQMCSAATTGDVQTFNAIVDAARPSSRAAQKLPRRIAVSLIYCKNCFGGHLLPAVVTGQGKRIKRTPMAKVPVPDSFVRGAVGDDVAATGQPAGRP
jgi:hypothetical protein